MTTLSRRTSRRRPAAAQDDKRLRGQRERPVDGPAERRRPRRDVRRRAARQRRAGRAHPAHRAPLAPCDDARDRLRRRPGDRAQPCRGFAAGAVRAHGRALHAAVGKYLAGLKKPPQFVRRDPQLRKLYDQSLLVLAASEDKLHRGASVASPTMPWVWGTLTLEEQRDSGPYHLVWPRDLYHVATAQKIAGDGAAADRLLDFLWSVQKPDGSFWQNTEVDGTEHWTGQQLDEDRAADRAVVVAAPPRRDRLGARAHGRRLPRRERARQRPGALGEPERLVAEHDRDRDRRSDLRRRHRAPQRRHGARATTLRGHRRRRGSASPGVDGDEQRPVQPEAVLPAPDQGREPERRHAPTTSATTTRPGRRARGRRPELSSAWCCSAPRGSTTRRSATRRGRRRQGPARRRRRTGRCSTASRSTATARSRDGGDWDISATRATRRSGACGRSCAGERGEYELLAGGNAKPYLQTIAGPPTTA